MNDREFLQYQLQSLAVYTYIIDFGILEKVFRNAFRKCLKQISAEKKTPLYFYFAGLRGNNSRISLEKKRPSLHSDDIEFTEDEEFNSLSFSSILNILQNHKICGCFDFNIQSLNERQSEYVSIDCCKKLIRMRNKLAHEQNSLDFKNADIIEVLPDTTLEGFIQKINETLSISQMLDDTKAIFSNIVFMRIMIEALESIERSIDHDIVDKG